MTNNIKHNGKNNQIDADSANNNIDITSKQSFESFIVEFKDTRESVMSILKIVIEQQKVNTY